MLVGWQKHSGNDMIQDLIMANSANFGKFGPEFMLKLYLVGEIGGSVFNLVHND